MARLEIIEFPDPRLRRQAARVTAFDESLNQLVDDLIETLSGTGSLALSAPQVGDLREVLVVDIPDDELRPRVYVNPEILGRSAWGLVEESCLSIPGIVGNVFRATQVRVRAQDRGGEVFERDLEGLNAVSLQHEMDHLAGKLFVDRLSVFRRLLLRRKLAAARNVSHETAA